MSARRIATVAAGFVMMGIKSCGTNGEFALQAGRRQIVDAFGLRIDDPQFNLYQMQHGRTAAAWSIRQRYSP